MFCFARRKPFIFILIKLINKYHAVNQETGQFPKFNLEILQMLYKTIEEYLDRKSTRLNSSHIATSRMPSSA